MDLESSQSAACHLDRLAGWLGCGVFILQALTCSLVQAGAEAGPSSPAPETLVLVGTMGYGQEQLAFFDGTNPGFRQALNVGDNIGGWSVKAIDFKQVTLKAGTRELQLAVGTFLRREEAGEWQLGGNAASTFSPPQAVARTATIPAARPAVPQNFSPKSKSADQKDLERWAEKKMSKQLAEMEAKDRKEKNIDKAAAKRFEEALKKEAKRHKHGQG